MKIIVDGSDAALHVATAWPSLAAFLAGWAFSVGLTMPVKKLLLPRRWDVADRDLAVRLIAFFSAMVPAGVVYVELGGSEGLVWLVMVFTGLWSPVAYALTILWLRTRKAVFWSKVADFLSADPAPPEPQP